VSPAGINREVVIQRTIWIKEMLEGLRQLPLEDEKLFFSDPRNPAAAESYLRRALEALMDLGRHILAKGFGQPVTSYKEIAQGLEEKGVLSKELGAVMRKMAGYRTRMVHFYHEIGSKELYSICKDHLEEIEEVLDEMIKWTKGP